MSSPLSYRPISNKVFVEAMIGNYENSLKKEKERNELEEINRQRRLNETSRIYEAMYARDQVASRRHSFIESVKANLLTEAIYKIMSESVREDLRDIPSTDSISRCLISNFLSENDINSILRKMRTGSVVLSEIYNLIEEHTQFILEECDKEESLCITQDMKDNFYNALDYTDAESVSEKIRERVADAIADFVDTNAKEHNEINDTLSAAAEKIENISSTGDEEKDESVAESYNMIARSKINDIRNRRKNVFHSLVTTMAEQVIRNKDMQNEFMSEGKLNMPKIVDRIELLYSFMETMNTTRLIKVDENYILETIQEMKK